MPRPFNLSLAANRLGHQSGQEVEPFAWLVRLMLAVAAGMSLIGVSLGALTATGQARAAPPTLPNQAELNIPISNSIDLEISKTVNNINPQEGEIIIYTITLTNYGPDEAAWIEVTDALPPGVTPVWSNSTRGIYTNSVWIIESLTRQESASLILAVTVDPGTAGSTITNTAKISAAEPPNSASYPDEARVTIMVRGTDLAVSKSVNLTELDKGEVITYTITVTNQGPDEATGVWLRDELPGKIDFGEYVATQGSYSVATGLWQVGELANRATATLLMSGRLGSCAGGGIITNTASITAADQADPNDENNEASVGIVSAGKYCLYLPIILKIPCSLTDTFESREASLNEWPEESDPYIMDYDNEGHFQIRTADPTLFYIAPLLNVHFDEFNYTIRSDIYWQYTYPGSRYGLVFGLIPDNQGAWRQAYRFLVDTNKGYYYLDRSPNVINPNRSWYNIVSSDAVSYIIKSDFQTNSLRVDHSNNKFHLYINNQYVTSTADSDYEPLLPVQVGLGVYPSNKNIQVDARFDNFRYCFGTINTDLEATFTLKKSRFTTPKD